jgi:hypothetical protein
MNRKRAIILISVFTAIVVINVVILYTIINPVYNSYQTSANSEVAQAVISDIFRESIIFEDENEVWPTNMGELTSLVIEDSVSNLWSFSLSYDSKQLIIMAISTGEMADGAGKKIEFNCDTGTWSGYGF